jgi:hypothetical protein
MVPAESETSPESALTARLRVASGLRPSRDSKETVSSTLGAPAPPLRGGGVSPLRAGAKNSRRSRRERRRPVGRRQLQAVVQSAVEPLWFRLRSAQLSRVFGRSTLLIGLTVCLTVRRRNRRLDLMVVHRGRERRGGVVGQGGGSGRPNRRQPTMNADDVTSVLEELCESRATALSKGDEAALKALTVPESAAAAADELIDLSTYADSDYSIDVEDVEIVAPTMSGWSPRRSCARAEVPGPTWWSSPSRPSSSNCAESRGHGSWRRSGRQRRGEWPKGPTTNGRPLEKVCRSVRLRGRDRPRSCLLPDVP